MFAHLSVSDLPFQTACVSPCLACFVEQDWDAQQRRANKGVGALAQTKVSRTNSESSREREREGE